MTTVIFYYKWQREVESHRLLDIAITEYLRNDHGEGQSYVMKEITDCNAECNHFELITKGGHGKPYLTDNDGIFFSISHSGDWWMCAVADSEVGLDIQEKEPVNAKKVAKRFFHPEEADWLEANGYEQFCLLWAYKESFLKFTGAGLSKGMDFFSVIDPVTRKPGLSVPKQLEISFIDDLKIVLSI